MYAIAFIRTSETKKAKIVIPIRQPVASLEFQFDVQIDHVLMPTMKIIASKSVQKPCQCTAVVTDTKPIKTANGPIIWMINARSLLQKGDSVGSFDSVVGLLI